MEQQNKWWQPFCFFYFLLFFFQTYLCDFTLNLFVRSFSKEVPSKKNKNKKNRFNEGIKDKFLYFKHYTKGKKEKS